MNNIKKSDIAFYVASLILIIISLLQITATKYVPSLDSGQHLYSINNLVEIIKGNVIIREYYEINHTVVGYWSAHFIIGLFHFFLPSWLAEKAYLFIYIIGVVLSFQYLLKSIKPHVNSMVSFLIFPFIFSSYQLLGYHTFSFAIIPYFLSVGYWLRFHKSLDIKNIFVFSVMLVFLFLSHALVFVFGCITIGILFIGQTINNIERLINKDWLIKLLKVTIAFLPSIILWIVYIVSVMDIDSVVEEYQPTFLEQFIELIRIRVLVGFHHSIESVAYIPLSILILILIIWVISKKVKYGKKSSFQILNSITTDENLFIITSVFFLALYFFAPNRISAGSLTNRFVLYFYFNLIIWISLKDFPKILNYLAILTILFSMIYARKYQVGVYETLSKDIWELKELESEIEPNSVVYHITESSNWTHNHFGLYVGTDKPLLNPRSYQCYGQFPIVFKFNTAPPMFLADKEVTPFKRTEYLRDSISAIFVDYLIIFEHKSFWNANDYHEQKERINLFFEQVYITSKERASLYKFKLPKDIASIENMIKHDSLKYNNIKLEAKEKNIKLTDAIRIEALRLFKNDNSNKLY